MTAYERKPNRVDAVLFDRSKGSPEKDGNWHEVVRMLGPYQTDIAMDTEGNEKDYRVFDVSTKTWIWVPTNHYVVRDADGKVWIDAKESFEEDFQAVSHNPFPNTYPTPFTGITYGGGVRG